MPGAPGHPRLSVLRQPNVIRRGIKGRPDAFFTIAAQFYLAAF